MNFKNFIKDKLLIIFLLILGIITIEIFLIPYPFGKFIRLYIPIVIFILYFIGILIEYFTKKNFYNNVIEMLNELDEKYLITEIVKSPNFIEGIILKYLLYQIDKSMAENVNKYKYMQEDYKDYIELWIHEIKIPISTSKMVIENNKNDTTKSIDEELDKVENYIEQALFYARSNTVEKDYYIRKVNLKDIVNESIRKNGFYEVVGNDIPYQDGVIDILKGNSDIEVVLLSEILVGEYEIRDFINMILKINQYIEIVFFLEKENILLRKYLNNLGITKIFINNENTIEQIAKDAPALQNYLNGKEIKKVIVIKSKIVNIVLG